MEEKPEYVYEADFKEVGNIKMDSLSRSCFNNGKIYMASTDIEYGKDYQVKSSKIIFYNVPLIVIKLDRQR